MLTYNFENIGSDTLYEYLYKCIKNDIIQGKIKSGEKLPSKRALAKNLAVSVITVENAYGQLAAEGYIYSVPKSGFYVADLRDDRMKMRVVYQKIEFTAISLTLPVEKMLILQILRVIRQNKVHSHFPYGQRRCEQ